jgi:hypothetical protein
MVHAVNRNSKREGFNAKRGLVGQREAIVGALTLMLGSRYVDNDVFWSEK